MSFEECEISVVELKSVMFKSFYAWMVSYNSLHFASFTNFWFFFSLIGDVSCIIAAISIEIDLLIKGIYI